MRRRDVAPLRDVRDEFKRPIREHISRPPELPKFDAQDAPADARAYPRWLASLVARHGHKEVARVDFEPDTAAPSESAPTDPLYVARVKGLIEADRSPLARRTGE